MATKSHLHPVWKKFNYIAHRNLKSGYELRQCLASKVVRLFANLSSHLHSSWRQITYFELICSPIGKNPNGSTKTAHPKSRTRTLSRGPSRFSATASNCLRPRVLNVKDTG